MGAVLRAYMEEPALARLSLKPASKLGVVFPSRPASCPSAIPASDAPSHAHPG